MRHRLCKVISCDSGLERVQTAGEAHPESKECVAIAFENEPDNWHSHPRRSLPRDPYTKLHLPFASKVTGQHRPPEILVMGIAHLQGHEPGCQTLDWIDHPFSD